MLVDKIFSITDHGIALWCDPRASSQLASFDFSGARVAYWTLYNAEKAQWLRSAAGEFDQPLKIQRF